MKYLISVLILVFISQQVVAQDDVSKKALKYWSQYIEAMKKNDRVKAIELLDKAILEDPNFKKARKEKASYFSYKNEFDNALKHYMYIIEHELKIGASDYYYAGRAAFRDRQYQKSIDLFKEMSGFNSVLLNMKEEGVDLSARAAFIMKAKASPVPFKPLNMGAAVNSSKDEYFPSITADKKTLIYTRKLDYDRLENEDFYISNWDGKKWTTSYNIGGPVNTKDNEGAQSITADGRYIFYTKCGVPGDDMKMGAVGGCDIYATSKKGKEWEVPFNLGQNVNSPFWDAQPSMSADGKTLYFVSARKGGRGGKDIWMSTFDGKKWMAAVNCGPTINTKKDEESPFIHPDGHTLYFSSDGHIGMGSYDLFVSTKDIDGNWSVPLNLGYPINDEGIERGLYVNTDGTLAYIASEREKGFGGLDIYTFDLPEHAQPAKVTYVKGVVSDAKSKKKLASDIELLDLATGDLHTITWSDGIIGEYLVCIPTGKNYALNVARDKYLFHSENFSLEGVKSYEPFIINVALDPIEIGKTVVLKNIFFELGSAELKTESGVELNKLKLYLELNTTVKIEIGGYSDTIGEEAFNLDLSTRRAKAVYDWLITQQADVDRVTYKGYGEANPIASNDTDEGRSQNRRTEFKVVGK